MAKEAMTRVNRLQRIEELLLTASYGYTVLELAKRLGVHRSIVYRDLEDLEQVTPLKVNGSRYSINRMEYLSNVRLTQGESLMLYLAIRLLIRRTSYIPPVMLSALEKLSLVLRDPLAPQVLSSLTMLNDRSSDPDRVQVWENLITAWQEKVVARIMHLKFDASEPSTYEFEPYFFEPAMVSDGVYVLGYSRSHEMIRTFKVERILKASLTTQHFERREEINMDMLLRHAWGIWYGVEPTIVRLRFRPPESRRVCETIWHPLQEIEELPDGSVEWRVKVAGTTELIPWIRGWGSAVEVLEPLALREKIANELRQACQLYEKEAE